MEILTQEQFLNRMLGNLNNHEDKTPNSFAYDILSATAIVFQDVQLLIARLEDLFDVDKREGEMLDKFIFQITGLTRHQATKSTGHVTVTGEKGTVIRMGTIFLAGDLEFISLEEKTIEENNVKIKVECQTAGSVGDVVPNSITKMKEPNGKIHDITNEEEFTNGYDEECDEDFRERYKDKLLNPPKAANPSHYKLWATEIDGIWTAKVFRTWQGPGSMRVVVVGTDRKTVDSEMIEKVKKHIMEEAPIEYKKLTVESAKEKLLNINVKIIFNDGYTEKDIKSKLKKQIEDYLFNISFRENEVSVAKIGSIILGLDEVKDYKELKINNVTTNITLADDEIPILQQIEVM